MIGRIMPYLDYLLSCEKVYKIDTGSGLLLPMWIVNERRTFAWMEALYRSMDHFSGYTISRQLRIRIAHAPNTHCKSFMNISTELHQMLNQFCDIFQDLNDKIISRYESPGAIVLLSREDREKWDEAREKIYELLYSDRPHGSGPPSSVDTSTMVSLPYNWI